MQSKPQGMLSHDSACNGYVYSEKLPVEKHPTVMQQCFPLAMSLTMQQFHSHPTQTLALMHENMQLNKLYMV